MFKDIINNFTKSLSDLQKKFTNPYEIKVDPALRNQLKKNDWTDEMVDNEFKTTAPIKPGTINKSANSSQPGFVQPNNVMHKDLINKVDINDGKITKSKTIPVSQYKKETQNMQPVAPVAPISKPVVKEEKPEFKIASIPEQKPQKKEKITATTETEKLWEQHGRPAVNPYMDILNEVFGEQAGDMNDILRWGSPDDQGYRNNYGGENLSFNAGQENKNNNGSMDLGLFQINSDTFNDLMRRKPELLKKAGIKTFEDMRDPLLNTKMAKIILDQQGYGAWYGKPDWLN